jgi:hypothetical protein
MLFWIAAVVIAAVLFAFAWRTSGRPRPPAGTGGRPLDEMAKKRGGFGGGLNSQ